MRGTASPDYIDEGDVLMRSQVMWPGLEECALENSVILPILVI